VKPASSFTRTEGRWATYTAIGPDGVATVARIARFQPSSMSTGFTSLTGYLLHSPTVPTTA
jgi:hypothetical protein